MVAQNGLTTLCIVFLEVDSRHEGVYREIKQASEKVNSRRVVIGLQPGVEEEEVFICWVLSLLGRAAPVSEHPQFSTDACGHMAPPSHLICQSGRGPRQVKARMGSEAGRDCYQEDHPSAWD